jgi:hypothetical protein
MAAHSIERKFPVFGCGAEAKFARPNSPDPELQGAHFGGRISLMARTVERASLDVLTVEGGRAKVGA